MPVHLPGQIRAPSFGFPDGFSFSHPLSLIMLVLPCLDLQPENTCVCATVFPTASQRASSQMKDPWMCAQSLQSCLTLCDRMDWNPSGSSVHRVLQARMPVGCQALFQGIFPTQGWNLCLLPLLHCRWSLYCPATGDAQI